MVRVLVLSLNVQFPFKNKFGLFIWGAFFKLIYTSLALMDLLSFEVSTSISNNYFCLEFQLTPQAILYVSRWESPSYSAGIFWFYSEHR